MATVRTTASGDSSSAPPAVPTAPTAPAAATAVAPPATTHPAVGGRVARARGLVRAARPHQWTKNVLVLAPLLPAGAALRHANLWGAAVAFVAFCLISSSVYLINDARDVEADRAHPVKCRRPIAAGLVSVPTAVATAVVLAVAALALSLVASWQLVAVIAVYYVVQLAYCFGLKHEPVLELACVASGFLLRTLAGGVATGVPLSEWFLLTTAFGSLYMAAGKRYGESRMGERTGNRVRRVVEKYSPTYLRFVWTLAATAVILTYALWSFQVARGTTLVTSSAAVSAASSGSGSGWAVGSLVPFALAILRFGIDVDAGTAEEPDEIVVHDRVLLVLGLAWAACLAIGVYL